MAMDRAECATRLAGARHGVLATVHPGRGVDAVPVCFVVEGERVVVPVDTVKAKRSPRLQRIANLDADPRATLLVEQWDDADWSRLWWVRASLERVTSPEDRRRHHESLLAAKYPQYRWDPDTQVSPFDSLLVLRIIQLDGWSAAGA
jgi:PPOX class probable F420-dependent enzyme